MSDRMKDHDVPSSAHNDAFVNRVISPWTFALSALAVYRLTRLVTADSITSGPRDAWVRAAYVRAGQAERARAAIVERYGAEHPNTWSLFAQDDPEVPKLAEVAICRWCCSVWCAAGALVLRRVAPRAWRLASEVLALSALGALISGLEKD